MKYSPLSHFFDPVGSVANGIARFFFWLVEFFLFPKPVDVGGKQELLKHKGAPLASVRLMAMEEAFWKGLRKQDVHYLVLRRPMCSSGYS